VLLIVCVNLAALLISAGEARRREFAIVGDVRSLGAAEPAPPAVYVPFAKAPRPPYEGRAMTFIVRTTRDPSAIITSARAAVTRIDAGLPLANVRPMREVVSEAGAQPRFTTTRSSCSSSCYGTRATITARSSWRSSWPAARSVITQLGRSRGTSGGAGREQSERRTIGRREVNLVASLGVTADRNRTL